VNNKVLGIALVVWIMAAFVNAFVRTVTEFPNWFGAMLIISQWACAMFASASVIRDRM
jgi:uncharacterized membrane protein YhdT